ncbi:hypothetical protein AN959_19465 [Psychrobacillus sp. FJAT-21963]|nr:hypothetical protein AN959_19465 [Psychrobacillus sp. FJAT-21963]
MLTNKLKEIKVSAHKTEFRRLLLKEVILLDILIGKTDEIAQEKKSKQGTFYSKLNRKCPSALFFVQNHVI